VIRTMLSRAKLGILMLLGFLLAVLLLLGALVLGVAVIEPTCNLINLLVGRP
jgi:hypothetical protein